MDRSTLSHARLSLEQNATRLFRLFANGLFNYQVRGISTWEYQAKENSIMVKNIGNVPQGFESVSNVELQMVAGGLSWSGIWDSIKSAANWVATHVFVDFPLRMIGYKGSF